MAKKQLTQVESVAERLATLTDQNFQFLMKRFDRIEEQNDAQIHLMTKHNELDAAVHKVVERHSTYFSLMTLGIPVGIAMVMNKFGWKGL